MLFIERGGSRHLVLTLKRFCRVVEGGHGPLHPLLSVLTADNQGWFRRILWSEVSLTSVKPPLPPQDEKETWHFFLSLDAMFIIPQTLFLTFTSFTASGKLPRGLTVSPTLSQIFFFS